jgi:AcrR family transcriptional regulator
MEAGPYHSRSAAQGAKFAEYLGGEIVQTPWGDSTELRARRLAPGRGTPRLQVQENQRERLFGAMVVCVAEQGYAEVGVGDLSRVSGVSSRAFYELFDDKEACFLAAMEAILANVQGRAAAELGRDHQGPEMSAEQALLRGARAMAEMLVAQPAAARLWLVEGFCAGEAARARIDQALQDFSDQLQGGLSMLPGRAPMPAGLTRAILGGAAGVTYRRLAEGRESEVPEIAGDLLAWAISIPSPPAELRARSRRSRGEQNLAPPFAAHVTGERVLRGFACAVAEKGYAATTIADIAAAARISQNTFYAHFSDKEDAFYAALDSSGAQMVAATLPAVRRSPGWPQTIRVAAETACGFLAAEPAFAHLREVEVLALGPRAVAVRDRTGAELFELLFSLGRGTPPTPSALALEATNAALHALLYDQIRRSGAESVFELVPIATYLVLAPIIGAEAAHEVACG